MPPGHDVAVGVVVEDGNAILGVIVGHVDFFAFWIEFNAGDVTNFRMGAKNLPHRLSGRDRVAACAARKSE